LRLIRPGPGPTKRAQPSGPKPSGRRRPPGSLKLARHGARDWPAAPAIPYLTTETALSQVSSPYGERAEALGLSATWTLRRVVALAPLPGIVLLVAISPHKAQQYLASDAAPLLFVLVLIMLGRVVPALSRRKAE
jgi:hypothetical protein